MPEPSPIDRTGDEMEQSFGRDSQATDDAEIEGHLEQYSYKVGVAWPEGYREKFTLFKQRLVAQYKQVRSQYLAEYEAQIKELLREKTSEVELAMATRGRAVEKQQYHEGRQTVAELALDQVLQSKREKDRLKRRAFQAFKYHWEWKKYVQNKTVYAANFHQRSLARRVLKAWSTATHEEYRARLLKDKEEYEHEQKTKILYRADRKIEQLKLYLAHIMAKIEKETDLVVQLPDDYERIMGVGLDRLEAETRTLSQTALLTQIGMDARDPILS